VSNTINHTKNPTADPQSRRLVLFIKCSLWSVPNSIERDCFIRQSCTERDVGTMYISFSNISSARSPLPSSVQIRCRYSKSDQEYDTPRRADVCFSCLIDGESRDARTNTANKNRGITSGGTTCCKFTKAGIDESS